MVLLTGILFAVLYFFPFAAAPKCAYESRGSVGELGLEFGVWFVVSFGGVYNVWNVA